MTQLHPIFKKELDAFDMKQFINPHGEADYEEILDFIEVEKLKSFLLSALQRASLAVVEESVGKKAVRDNEPAREGANSTEIYSKEAQNNMADGWNLAQQDTLATAKTITSPNTGTLQG